MIEKFKRLRRERVRKFLQRMGTDPKVLSLRFEGMGSLMLYDDVYFYASGDEVVLVAIDDDCDGRLPDELAYEGPFLDDAPMYFNQSGRRVSPVWKLAMTCELLQRRIADEEGRNLKIWGMVLTSSNIINYDAMRPVWKDMQTKVFHQLDDLSAWEIPVNRDADLMWSLTYLHFFYLPTFGHDEVEAMKKHFAERYQSKKKRHPRAAT